MFSGKASTDYFSNLIFSSKASTDSLSTLEYRSLENEAVDLHGVDTHLRSRGPNVRGAPQRLVPSLQRMFEFIGAGEIYSSETLRDEDFPQSRDAGVEDLRNLASVVAMNAALAQRVEGSLADAKLSITVGGDHHISLGTLKGFASFCNKHGLVGGVVYIDAHGDYNAVTEGNRFRP